MALTLALLAMSGAGATDRCAAANAALKKAWETMRAAESAVVRSRETRDRSPEHQRRYERALRARSKAQAKLAGAQAAVERAC